MAGRTKGNLALVPAMPPPPTMPTDQSVQARAALRARTAMEVEDAKAQLAVEAATHVNPLDLERQFAEHSGHLSHWNARLALAGDAQSLAEAELERIQGRLYLFWREVMYIDGEKVTEALIDANVKQDPKYLDARLALIDAERDYQRTRGVVRAIEEKGRMLVALGAHIRAEMMGDPNVRAEQRTLGGRDR
jgi:hypothetical protein